MDAELLPYSKPPRCQRTTKGRKFSPAWEKKAEVVRLYREKNSHKAIARLLEISPRITREILILKANGAREQKPPGAREWANTHARKYVFIGVVGE